MFFYSTHEVVIFIIVFLTRLLFVFLRLVFTFNFSLEFQLIQIIFIVILGKEVAHFTIFFFILFYEYLTIEPVNLILILIFDLLKNLKG